MPKVLSRYRNSNGFTLVEVLIAIAIVGIITSIGFASARAIQRAGRDAQRKTDLRNLQSSLQQYYTDQNSYPVSLPAVDSPLKDPGNTKTYLNKIPSDPSTKTAYYYLSTCDPVAITVCHSYVLCTSLEGGGSDSCNAGAYNYQLTPTN